MLATVKGDSFSHIFSSLGLSGSLINRNTVIIGLTTAVVFPLCCLRRLDALKYTSILGLAGTVYCALFMGLRLLDGSYREGGQFFDSIEAGLRPSFNQAAKKVIYCNLPICPTEKVVEKVIIRCSLG